jgi:hypothetical protein
VQMVTEQSPDLYSNRVIVCLLLLFDRLSLGDATLTKLD